LRLISLCSLVAYGCSSPDWYGSAHALQAPAIASLTRVVCLFDAIAIWQRHPLQARLLLLLPLRRPLLPRPRQPLLRPRLLLLPLPLALLRPWALAACLVLSSQLSLPSSPHKTDISLWVLGDITTAAAALNSLEKEKKKVMVKVGMVGDSQIGKTSLMVKYVEGKFQVRWPSHSLRFVLATTLVIGGASG
jgi:hypothetical protein